MSRNEGDDYEPSNTRSYSSASAQDAGGPTSDRPKKQKGRPVRPQVRRHSRNHRHPSGSCGNAALDALHPCPLHRATSPAEPDPEQSSSSFLHLYLCVCLSRSGSHLRLGSKLRQLVIVCARVRGFATRVHVAAQKHPRKRGHGLQAWVPDLSQEPHTSRRGAVEPCSHAGASCSSAV